MKIGRFYLQIELVFFIFILTLSRLLTVAAFPNPSLQPDSGSYSANSIFDFSLVSFLGNSIRSWPTPFIFALAPSESGKILGLILVSFISWAFFAYVVLSVQSGRIKKNLTLLILVIVSTNPNLVQWETVLLGQSLMISNTLFLISTLILLSRNQKSWKISLVAVFLANFLYLQKSSNIVIAVLATILVLKMSWKFSSVQTKAALAGVSLIFFGYSTFVGMNVDKARSNRQTLQIDCFNRSVIKRLANANNTTVFDGNAGLAPRLTATIDHYAIYQQQITVQHV
jgi:hypothetical protein